MTWRAAIVLVAVAAALAPLPAGAIDRWYSNGVYAWMQPALTGVSNHVPFALFDALLVLVPLVWLLLIVFDAMRGLGAARAAARAGGRLIVWGAALYLAFLALWGLNYRREPLTAKLAFDANAVTPDAARALAVMTVDRLNFLHDAAHRQGWTPGATIDTALVPPFATAVRDAGGASGIVPGLPKRTLLDLYFRRAGVSGMTDPYFLETMVSSDLLPFERPFVMGHEWAHVAGFANEGEASFIGWLACMRAGLPEQYSGWLSLYGEVQASLPARLRKNVAARLSSGPREDLSAIDARIARELSPRLSEAGWRAYDRYLKANRVDAGTASYAEVVRLVLGSEVTAAIRSSGRSPG